MLHLKTGLEMVGERIQKGGIPESVESDRSIQELIELAAELIVELDAKLAKRFDDTKPPVENITI